MSNFAKPIFKPREIVCAALMVVSLVVGIIIGSTSITKGTVMPMQREAISKGFAQWIVVDQENGRTEFAWKVLEPSTNNH